jgi:hypothetical protein
MNGSMGATDATQVESSLRTAIKLNPSFAPAYDMLAVFLGMRNRNLDEARMMALTAVSLDPANVGYRINVANVLMAMGENQNAVVVLRAAAKLAKTPQESQSVDTILTRAQEYADDQEQARKQNRQSAQGQAQEQIPSSVDIPQLAHRKEFIPSGPHRFVVGVLKDIHCTDPNLDLTITSGTKKLPLHTDNYYKIQFTALNFQPSSDLKPCSDLENRPAKVEYVESADKTDVPHLIAIELHK